MAYNTTSAYIELLELTEDTTSLKLFTKGTLPRENNQIKGSVLDIVYFVKLFVIVFGSIGNCLNVAIWLSMEYRKMSRSVVYVTLSVVNTTFLVLQLGQSTTVHFNGGHFLAHSDISCQIKSILLLTSDHLDSYLILFLCFERFVAVFRPLAVKMIFDRTKIAIYVLTIVLASLVVHAIIAIYDVSSSKLPNGKSVCKVDETPRVLIREIILGYLHFAVMIPCNIVIIVTVIRQYRIMKHCIVDTQHQVQKTKSIRVSIFTLSITLSYIALMLPNKVYFICCRQTYMSSKLFIVMVLLPMMNAAINFYMFMMSSKEYREKVKFILCKIATHASSCMTSLCPKNSVEPAP